MTSIAGFVARRVMVLLAGTIVAGVVVPAADADVIETPEARTMNVAVDDGSAVARGFVVDVDGVTWRIGVIVVCDRATGRLEGHLSFGSFPNDRPVQATVRTASGMVERFGQVLMTNDAALAGYHSPLVEARDDVLRLTGAAFSEGALVSNGWCSIWNRIPADENTRARDDILECAG